MTAEQEIRSLLTTYEGALQRLRRLARRRRCTPDGVFMPHQFPSSVGPDVEGAYRQAFEAIGLDIVFSVDEVTVNGDFAYALTRSKGSQTINATGDISAEENRELFTFAKESGAWKIARYIFNKMS